MSDKVYEDISLRITKGRKKSYVRASNLSSFYNYINKMCSSNWYGTSGQMIIYNPTKKVIHDLGCGVQINLGQVVFDRILELANGDKKFRLFYPNLIYQMLVQQGYVSSEKEKKTMVKANLVKEERSFVSKSNAKRRVLDLPFESFENLEEKILYKPVDTKKSAEKVEVSKEKQQKKRKDEIFLGEEGLSPSSLPRKLMVYDNNELDDPDSDDGPASFLLAAPTKCLSLLNEVIKYNETGAKILRWVHKNIETHSLGGG